MALFFATRRKMLSRNADQIAGTFITFGKVLYISNTGIIGLPFLSRLQNTYEKRKGLAHAR
jgi:hypothetical protein